MNKKMLLLALSSLGMLPVIGLMAYFLFLEWADVCYYKSEEIRLDIGSYYHIPFPPDATVSESDDSLVCIYSGGLVKADHAGRGTITVNADGYHKRYDILAGKPEGYSLSLEPGTYDRDVTLKINVKKGWHLYCTTKEKFVPEDLIVDGLYEVNMSRSTNVRIFAFRGRAPAAKKANTDGGYEYRYLIKKVLPEIKRPEYSVTYGTKLDEISLPDGFKWAGYPGLFEKQTFACTMSRMTGSVGEHYFLASYTPADPSRFLVVNNIPVKITVTKARPEIEIPVVEGVPYGTKLGQINLPEGYSWQDDAETPVGGTGEHDFLVTYTPEDTANYKVVKNIPVNIKVDSIPLEDDQVNLDDSDVTYDGNPKTPEVHVASDSSVLTEGQDYIVTYHNNISPGTASVTVEGTGDYSGSITKTFEIKKSQKHETGSSDRHADGVQSWFDTLSEIGKVLYEQGFRYSNSKGNREWKKASSSDGDKYCNCARFVSWALQAYGPTSERGYKGTVWSDGKKMRKSDGSSLGSNLEKIDADGQTAKELGSDLLPGDICFFRMKSGNGHVAVYAGKDEDGKNLWFNAGRNVTDTGKAGGYYMEDSVGPSSKDTFHNNNKIITILRIISFD